MCADIDTARAADQAMISRSSGGRIVLVGDMTGAYTAVDGGAPPAG